MAKDTDWTGILKIGGIIAEAIGGACDRVADHMERRKYRGPPAGASPTMQLSQSEVDTINKLRESQKGP
ncbi:MAG: hypothetical protein JSW41_03815 [Candidatus Aenigmatarchaeota archaeon]|nr:MAG: hypothetical protein JSW41_03815 [Candidatus Aenigmarchaeota archaeon]